MFHPPSGDTHVLNPVAAEALKRLERSAASVEGLTQAMAEAVGVEPDGRLEHDMQQLIARFDELGLIEPVGL